MNFSWCAVAVLALGFASIAPAETASLPPSKDNTLFSTNGTTSNGAGDAVFSGRTGFNANGTRQRAVLAFDIPGSIPADSTVTSVSLTLTLINAPFGGGDQNHTLHRVLDDWGEGTSAAPGGLGGPATPEDATWKHTFFPDQFWANEGGDFDPLSSGNQTVGVALVPYTWASTPQMVADAQAWLDEPETNFGWLLMGNEDAFFTAKKFASRENLNEAIRPVLTVEFTASKDCPADLDGNAVVDAADLAELLSSWGECGGCPADFNGDGVVDAADLAGLLSAWGRC